VAVTKFRPQQNRVLANSQVQIAAMGNSRKKNSATPG
jgi:hypothetical protein